MNNIISYVIRTKNEEELLEETCIRIRKQEEQLKHEIIIVDSGSTDGTLNIAKKYADKIINIIPGNFTWGRALNQGIAVASGDVVCLVSGHCLIAEDRIMEKVYKRLVMSDYVCLYGKQKGNIYMDKMEAIELSEIFPDHVVDSRKSKHIPGISNACCIFKKDVWKKHFFNETVQSSEDGIWCQEILNDGYCVEYYPSFCVIHAHHFNAEYMYKKWYWRIYKSESILGRDKNWSKANKVRFLLAFVKGMLIKQRHFYKQSVKIGIHITKKSCRKYFIIREYATYKAKLDLKNRKNMNLKYEDLVVPRVIVNIQNYIEPGDFYEV